MCLREPLTVLSMVTQIFSFEPLHHGMGKVLETLLTWDDSEIQ